MVERVTANRRKKAEAEVVMMATTSFPQPPPCTSSSPEKRELDRLIFWPPGMSNLPSYSGLGFENLDGQ
jgi:hypothetical protein